MTFENRIALFLLNELFLALRANDPDTFKRWLSGGVQDLGKPAVEELLLDWLAPFLIEVEKDRLIASHLGVSFYTPVIVLVPHPCDQPHRDL